MDDTDNPLTGILGSNVLAPPSDIAGALQGLLNPGNPRMQQLRGGLGAGLTAAANNGNKPALAAFAGGAGGALQGVNQAAQQQTDNRLKAVQAALQAWQAGDIPALRQAQADYYRALAQRAAGPQAASPAPPASPQPSLNPSTAGASVIAKLPPIPTGVPAGAGFSPSRNQWRSSDGRLFDMAGNEVPPSGAGTPPPSEMA